MELSVCKLETAEKASLLPALLSLNKTLKFSESSHSANHELFLLARKTSFNNRLLLIFVG